MPEIQWWYARGDQQFGPVSPAELRRLASSGSVLATDLVWREGLAEWAPAARLKSLFPDAPSTAREAGAGATAPTESDKPVAAENAGTASKPTTAEKSAAPDGSADSPRTEVATQETAELRDRPPSDPNFEGFTVVEQPPGAPPVELPPPPPSHSGTSVTAATGSTAAARQLQRQRISYARLTSILAIVQASLWGICVLVVLLGGLVFTWGRLHGKSSADEMASAVVLGMFFVGAFVIARAGQEISRLVLAHLEKRRG